MKESSGSGSSRNDRSKDDIERDIHIYLQREDVRRTISVGPDHRLMDLLKNLDIPMDGVIAFSDGSPVPLDDIIWDLKMITIVNVASGG
jgi:sulfur carrier protein ThiS